MQSPYIENCFSLTPKRIDDCLNRIGRKIGDNTDPERPDLKYEYDQKGEQYYKTVTVGGNEPQKIALETVETSFGEREYFLCNGCNSRCNKLFLLPGGHILRCMKCHKIKRQSFNPSSKQGELFIRAKKILKLIDERANMTSRIWYRSTYTKRYAKFLNGCLKVGLTDVVEEARALEALIKANG